MKIWIILTKSQKSLEDSVVLIDGVTGTVKHEIKKQEDRFLGALLAPLAASLVQPVVSSVVKTISGRAVTIARRRYRDKNFLVLLHPFSEIETTNCFNNKPRFNGVFSRNNLPRIKNRTCLINIDNKKVKEHIEFHYLLIEIQLHTLIILDLTIFLRKY